MKNYYELNNLLDAKFVAYENGRLDVKVGNTTVNFPKPDVTVGCHIIGLFETIKQSKGLWEAVTDGLKEGDVLNVLLQYVQDCMKERDVIYDFSGKAPRIDLPNGIVMCVSNTYVLAFACLVTTLLQNNDSDKLVECLRTYYLNVLKNE